jgi:hypothetical protein
MASLDWTRPELMPPKRPMLPVVKDQVPDEQCHDEGDPDWWIYEEEQAQRRGERLELRAREEAR